MEWTLCRWILVKDASRGCDSVINLGVLQTEKPATTESEAATSKRTQQTWFFAGLET